MYAAIKCQQKTRRVIVDQRKTYYHLLQQILMGISDTLRKLPAFDYTYKETYWTYRCLLMVINIASDTGWHLLITQPVCCLQ